MAYVVRISEWISDVCSADLGIGRMKVTEKPFDDVRVRKAVQLCMNTHEILKIAYRGRGQPGGHNHVAPIHRSAKRRAGKESVSTCRSRWSQYHYKQQTNSIQIPQCIRANKATKLNKQ